jgi:hypothetical protein
MHDSAEQVLSAETPGSPDAIRDESTDMPGLHPGYENAALLPVRRIFIVGVMQPLSTVQASRTSTK